MRISPPAYSIQTGEGHTERIKVLMYHRVVDTFGVHCFYPEMCITAKDFAIQMDLLDRLGFTAITFEDYRFFMRGDLDLPKKPVILTFDDAYLDFYQNAFPILRENGMKGVIFRVARKEITASVWDKGYGLPVAPLMSEQQIVELHEEGFEIGSHSLTHAALPELRHERAWEEIYNSRMALEILLNAPVRSFSFPYGRVSGPLKRMVEDAGYEMGCATYSGPPKFLSDPFEIRRVLITGNISHPHFALMMMTPYEYVLWTRWKIKELLIHMSGKGNHAREDIAEEIIADNGNLL